MMSSLSQLQSILVNTYNPDQALRKEAESLLKQFIYSSNALSILFQFIGDHNIHRDLRQAAAISIKNNARDFFRIDEKAVNVLESEKEVAKVAVLEIILVETDNSVRGLLAETIRNIAEFEYPQRWPSLLPTLLTFIQTPDILKMYNALLALRKLVKRYEYKHKEARDPLHHIVEVAFPILLSLLIQIKDNNQLEAAQVIRMISKIFWSCTQYQLPTVQGVNVEAWFSMFAHLLDKNLPEAHEGLEPSGQPTSKEERDAWPWWKVKKWSARIIQHFMTRYGNPQHCGDENKTFATYFRSHTAPSLLPTIMRTLASHHTESKYLTEHVQRSCLAFVAGAVEMSPTYKIIKPHLDFLLFGIIFPTLCITDTEIRLFEEDPVEFVRKVHNPMEDWLDPRVAATNVLQTLARYRQKDTMPKLLQHCNGILNVYLSALPNNKDYRKKDGVLVAIAAVAKIMTDSSKYKSQLEPFVTLHLIPEFQSPVGFMRCRACWAIEYVSDLVDWKKMSTALQTVLQGLLQGLKDPCLPTQTAAACALRLLVRVPGTKPLLRPVVHEIVGEFFRIMSEVDNDAVLGALQEIVLEYGEEIINIAPAVIQELLRAFSHYSSAGEDDDESLFSAAQCLETITSVLDVCKEETIILLQIEDMLIPVLSLLISDKDDSMEYLDNVVTMLSYLTFYNDNISPKIWQLFGPLLVALDSWAYDYLPEISVPLLNYISKDSDNFLQGTVNGESFIDKLLPMMRKYLDTDRNDSEREAQAAARILTSIVTSCRGRIDRYIPYMFQLVALRISDAHTVTLRIRLLEVAMASIHYDPLLATELFRADPATTERIFQHLFEKLGSMSKASSRRLIVLAFSSLLSVPSSALPPIVTMNLQPILRQMIREVVLLEEEAAEEDEEDGEEGEEEEDEDQDADDDDEEDDEEDEEEDVGKGVKSTSLKVEGGQGEELTKAAKRAARLAVPEDGYDEDEDCVDVEDEEYRAALEAADETEGIKRQLFLAGQEIDDEEEDDEDEEDFVSQLDNIDVGQTLCMAVLGLSRRETGLYEALRSGLDEEDTLRLDSLLQNKLKESRG